jgi:hypothetical protein
VFEEEEEQEAKHGVSEKDSRTYARTLRRRSCSHSLCSPQSLEPQLCPDRRNPLHVYHIDVIVDDDQAEGHESVRNEDYCYYYYCRGIVATFFSDGTKTNQGERARVLTITLVMLVHLVTSSTGSYIESCKNLRKLVYYEG